MTFMLIEERSLAGVPIIDTPRRGNVVRRPWRLGDSLPHPIPEDSIEAEILQGVWS